MSTTDVQFVEQARAGDQGSMKRLLQRASNRVARYLDKPGTSQELVEDLTQDTVLSIINSFDQLRRSESFWPWVMRIAANKRRQHYRCARYQMSLSEQKPDGFELADTDELEASQELCRQELFMIFQEAMEQLREKHRLVLNLRYFEYCSYSKIALLFDCNEANARILVHRAKSALRKELVRRGVDTYLPAA
jgi:RNA polymerase sigma-70 factor (ECF subfamily)